jgi:hypothetical protein
MTTMTTIAAIAKPMVFLDISTSSPHSSAQRMLRPIPRIVQRPGYPEGYPGPFQTSGMTLVDFEVGSRPSGTLAGGENVEEPKPTRASIYRSWWHHPRPHSMHKRAKYRPRPGGEIRKARPLPNLTPSPLNVVNVYCSVFKAQERGYRLSAHRRHGTASMTSTSSPSSPTTR